MMQRIGALLQRHGRVWRAPRWTYQHRAWLDRQSFDEPALQAALRTYLAALDARDAELAVLEGQLRGCWVSVDPLASMVRRLGCYRGIAELTGLALAAEVAGFRRFASAPAFMGFTGLTPSEYSSGARTRRGGITKAGPQLIRSTLIEAAWAYRHRPAIGATLRRRQAGCPEQTLARSWKAQQRLHATYAKLTRRGKIPSVAVTAVARVAPGTWPSPPTPNCGAATPARRSSPCAPPNQPPTPALNATASSPRRPPGSTTLPPSTINSAKGSASGSAG
jgi:transposase